MVSALRTLADELERAVRRAADTDLPDDRKDQVLARHEGTEPAGELDLDGRRNRLPELAEGEAGGDVGRAEAAAEGAERAVGAGVGVATGDDRAGNDPSLLAQERVLDPAAALGEERHPLLRPTTP